MFYILHAVSSVIGSPRGGAFPCITEAMSCSSHSMEGMVVFTQVHAPWNDDKSVMQPFTVKGRLLVRSPIQELPIKYYEPKNS